MSVFFSSLLNVQREIHCHQFVCSTNISDAGLFSHNVNILYNNLFTIFYNIGKCKEDLMNRVQFIPNSLT